MTSQTMMSSHELQVIIKSAAQLAGRNQRKLTTLHVMLAAMDNNLTMVHPILSSLGLRVKGTDGIQEAIDKLAAKEQGERLSEPDDTMRLLHSRACEMAARHESLVNSLFYFITMIRMPKALGTRVLEQSPVDLSQFRRALLARISTLTPLGVPDTEGPAGKDHADEPSSPPPSPTPQLTRGGSAAVPNSSPPAAPVAQLPIGGQVAAPGEAADRSPGEPSTIPAPGNQDPGGTSPHQLNAEEFPLLCKLTTNLSLRADCGEIDPVIGRDKEIRQMVDILKKRRSNNPCLVGEPGVGKTALVEGLALAIVRGDPGFEQLRDRTVLALETAALVAGTQLRGSFSDKMIQLKEEVAKAKERVIIFIDEIHTIIGAGAGEGKLDAANELKTVLARGQFPTIGATTLDEYKANIERDPALARRFVPVYLNEPSVEEARRIVAGIAGLYEKHHRVAYEPRALDAAVRLSVRYIPDRRLPAKAIEVLDTAGARAQGMKEVVTEEDVALTISDQVGVPVERLLLNYGERLRQMAATINLSVIGHQEPVARVCDALKRGFAGFAGNRPLASFIFAGPPGVGKGQTAKALARFLFDRDDAILSFQGTEFTEKHSVAKLIGAGPGYVGFERGGRLTEGMFSRPFRLILFRDLMFAHADVQELVAEMLLTGTLTDGQHRKVHFSNAVVVISQDLPADSYFRSSSDHRVGFSPDRGTTPCSRTESEILRQMAREFPDHLLQAVDERLVFFPLTPEQIRQVVMLEVAAASGRLEEERNISFELSSDAVNHLIATGGFSATNGGRLMKQMLARTVESYIADQIHSGQVASGSHLIVSLNGKNLTHSLGQRSGETLDLVD